MNRKVDQSYLLFWTFLFLPFEIYSQIENEGSPPSFLDSSCAPQKTLQCHYLPSVDNDSLLLQDSLLQANSSSNAFNFGYTLEADHDIQTSGRWETLTDSSRLWRLHLSSQDALSSFLVFDEFFIPEGGELYAYDEGRSQVLGAFTEENNKAYGSFSLGPISGGSVILEYHEPSNLDTSARIGLEAFVHSFKPVFQDHVVDSDGDPAFDTSGDCQINAKCPLGNGWCDQRGSVALIAQLDPQPGHFSWLCSGSLVVNERRDDRPYFLTADHCVNGRDVSNWIFIFNYQSQGCATPANAPSTDHSISGATVRADHQNSDFALLELSERPPGDYNVYYSGWDNDDAPPDVPGRGIHHPSGDVKRINMYGGPPKDTTVVPKGETYQIDAWKVHWVLGATEGGSSGSPLFNPDGLIVGQLIGSNESCDGTDSQNGPSFYGRFDISWDHEALPSDQLRHWLNPNGTSSFYLQSMSGTDPCRSSIFFDNANDLHTSVNVDGLNDPNNAGSRSFDGVYTSSGTIEAENNVTVQQGTSVEFQGNKVHLKPGFHAEKGSEFRAAAEPCLSGCDIRSQNGPTNGRKPFVTFNRSNVTGQEENEDLSGDSTPPDAKIFPNPNQGRFQLEFLHSEDRPSRDIYIYNSYGETVKRIEDFIGSEKEINMDEHSRGVYYMRIVQEEKTLVKRFVIH